MTLQLPIPMSEIPQTRQSLLLELGRRSDGAWAEFLQVYESAIYRLCRSKGLQDADAEDVTQDVLAAVHQRVATWDHDSAKGSFRAWILQVARNISVDSITDRARRVSASGDSQNERVLDLVPDRSGDLTEFDLEYSRSLFEWAANAVRSEVREATWKAFQLTAIQGVSPEQTAAQLEMPIGSVYTAKCRVVARIRDRVAAMERDN